MNASAKRRLTMTTSVIAMAAAVATTSGTAHAQAQVEEVVVTARKREESLQDVPVAVTALSGGELANKGVQSPRELATTVPGLAVGLSAASATAVVFSIRGQTASDVLLTIDQAVGVYVDGINVPRPTGLDAGFVDLQRVEVVKGPQGTLYGRNTTGGAVNVITRAPDFDGVHGFLTGELGNHKDLKASGAINLPIIDDTLATRLVFQRWQREGFGHSAVTGQDLGRDHDQTYFRASINYRPTSALLLELKGDWYRARENGTLSTLRKYVGSVATDTQAAFDLGFPNTVAGRAAARQFIIDNYERTGNADFFTNYSQERSREDTDFRSLTGIATIDLSDSVTLKSLSGYRRFSSSRAEDRDATPIKGLEAGVAGPGPFYLPGQPNQAAEFYSQEVNLSGVALDGRFNWLMGAYYSYEDGEDRTTNTFRPTVTALTSPYIMSFNDGYRILNKSWALYTQNDFKITDQLGITLGARYTEESHFLESRNRRFASSTGLYQCNTTITIITPTPAACAVKQTANFDGVSWLASLNYKVNPETLVYLKTSKGFKGGGWNLRLPAAPPFAPETAQDIELGLKSDLFQNRLRANIAAYRTSYKNKQESIIIPLGLGSATVIQNAASATIKGFEVELSAEPVDNLTLRASVAYLYGKYKSFPGALSIAGAVSDATGEKFPNPPWTYNLSARYHFDVGPGELAFQGDWSWTAGARPSPRNIDPALPRELVDDFVGTLQYQNGKASLGLLNARVSYDLPDSGLEFAVFSTNLLNKKYQYAGIAQPNVGNLQLGATGEPRMWGVQVRKSFGE